jgi:predicted ester cyclase
MSTEENKAVVLRYFLETHNPPYDLSVIGETCAPEYAKGRWRWMRIERAAWPDARYTIEDVLTAEDKIVLRVQFTGTHLGPFWTPVGTVPPTGKECCGPAIGIYRVSDGRIVEEWWAENWLPLLRQVGAEVTFPGLDMVVEPYPA